MDKDSKADRKSFCDSIMAMEEHAWSATREFLRQHHFVEALPRPPAEEPAKPKTDFFGRRVLSADEKKSLEETERLGGVARK